MMSIQRWFSAAVLTLAVLAQATAGFAGNTGTDAGGAPVSPVSVSMDEAQGGAGEALVAIELQEMVPPGPPIQSMDGEADEPRPECPAGPRSLYPEWVALLPGDVVYLKVERKDPPRDPRTRNQKVSAACCHGCTELVDYGSKSGNPCVCCCCTTVAVARGFSRCAHSSDICKTGRHECSEGCERMVKAGGNFVFNVCALACCPCVTAAGVCLVCGTTVKACCR